MCTIYLTSYWLTHSSTVAVSFYILSERWSCRATDSQKQEIILGHRHVHIVELFRFCVNDVDVEHQILMCKVQYCRTARFTALILNLRFISDTTCCHPLWPSLWDPAAWCPDRPAEEWPSCPSLTLLLIFQCPMEWSTWASHWDSQLLVSGKIQQLYTQY